MALTASQLALATFGAAVGGYKTTIDSFVTANGEAAAINALIAGSSLNGLANGVFAAKLVDLVVGSSATTANKNWLANAIEANLNGGQSKATMVGALINALSDTALASSADWGTAATQFQNRVSVSDYYAAKTDASTDLTTLTNIANQVTSTAASVTAAKASIDGGVAGYNSFSLTSSTTADTPAMTSANDVVTAAAGTLNANDLIIDTSTADTDILNVSMNSYVATTATITNVETINATGVYASVGLDLTNVTGTKALNLASGVSGSTATAANVASSKVAAITSGANVGTLNVTAAAAGTGANVNVTAGSATTTVAVTGGAGADTLTVNAVAASTLTLDGAAGADAFTINLAGGANSMTVTAGTIEKLTLNSNTAANTITLANANAIAGVATGDVVTVGGDQALTIKADLDAFSSAALGTNVSVVKAAGAGVVTLQNTAGLTNGFLNRAVVDAINLTTATGADLTINQDTTLKMSVANGSQAYDVGNSTSTALTAGSGTLKMDLTGTSVQTSVTTGLAVGTLVLTNNTIASELTTLDTNGTATSVDTVVVSGSKDLTIGTWTATTNELLTATDLTGKLTITVGANAATVIGGSGNDSITGGGAADNLRGGSGNDTINGGAFADTLTGGTGDDRFVIANGATTDTITDFSISGTNGTDVIAFSIADTSVLSAPKDGNAVAITAGTVAKAVHVSAATTLAAGQNIVVVDGTFATSALLEVAIEANGSRALTLASAPTANDDIIVVWTDGTNAHIGGYNLATTATTPTAAGTYTELVTLTGVTDVSSIATSNFLFIA